MRRGKGRGGCIRRAPVRLRVRLRGGGAIQGGGWGGSHRLRVGLGSWGGEGG